MHRDTQTFLKHLCHLFFLKRVSRALPLITIPLLARTIGIEQLGIIKFIEAISSYFLAVISYGFRYTATQQIAQYKENKRVVGQLLGTVYTLKLVAIVLCLVVAGGLILCVPKIQQFQTYFWTYFLVVIIHMLFPSFVFQGLDKMPWMTLTKLLAKGVLLTGVIMFIRSPADALLYHIFLGIVDLLQLIIALYATYYLWGIRIRAPTRSMMALQLRQGLHIFLSQLSITFYTRLPAIFLGFLVNPSSVAIYLLGVKAVRFITIMVDPFTRALFPLAHKKLAESLPAGIRFISKLAMGSLAMLVALGGCYWLLATAIVQLLAGKVIQDAVWILKLHAFLPCMVILSNILGMGLLIPMGAGRKYTLVSWTTGLLCVGLHLALVPQLRARGAALAILLCEGFSTAMMSWVTYRQMKVLLGQQTVKRV